MGSNYYPWGPHGERVSPLEVNPNPTPSTPPLPFDPPFSAPNYAPPAASGGYANFNAGANARSSAAAASYANANASGGIARVGNFLVSLPVVAFFWQFFVCLYPLPSLAAVVTTVYSAGILVRYFTPDPVLATNTFLAALIACGAGIAVLVVASRIEQRFARHLAYRIGRHAVRLALFALMAVGGIEGASGIPMISGLFGDLFSNLFSGPGLAGASLANIGANLTRILRTPDYLIAVFVFVVIMHVVLLKADTLRAFWHRRLAAIGLRQP